MKPNALLYATCQTGKSNYGRILTSRLIELVLVSAKVGVHTGLRFRHEGLALPLKYPDYGKFWLVSILSAFGNQIGWIALIWLVLHVGGGAVAVGIATLLYQLPQAVTAPLAGVWLDRFSRSRVMAYANLLLYLLFICIPVVATLLGNRSVDILYVLITVAGLILPFDSTGGSALVAELVPEPDRSQAYFLRQTESTLAMLLGPAVGGILVAAIGTESLLYVDAGTFLVCGAALLSLPNGSHKATESIEQLHQSTLVGEFLDGVRFMFRFPPIVALSILSLLFFFFYGPYEVILPVLSKARFGGAAAFGFLWTVFAVGSLVGTLIFSSGSWKYRLSNSLLVIIVLWGVVTILMGYASHLSLALVLMGIAGFVFSPWGALVTIARQKVVPPELYSRMAGSLRAITAGGMPLRAWISGIILHQVGPSRTLLWAGIATMVVGFLGFFWKTFRRIDT